MSPEELFALLARYGPIMLEVIKVAVERGHNPEDVLRLAKDAMTKASDEEMRRELGP